MNEITEATINAAGTKAEIDGIVGQIGVMHMAALAKVKQLTLDMASGDEATRMKGLTNIAEASKELVAVNLLSNLAFARQAELLLQSQPSRIATSPYGHRRRYRQTL